MNGYDFLDAVFGDDVTVIAAFTDDQEIEVFLSNFDQNTLNKELPGAFVDLTVGDKAYAVVTNQLPLDQANVLIQRDGKDYAGVFILEEPAHIDDVPQDWDACVSMDADRTFADQGGDLKFLSELLAMRDEKSDETVPETPVEVSDVADEEGGTTTPSEASEEPSKLNDADILGNTDIKLGEFLEQPMVFMTGDLYPADNRRSTRDGDWNRTELSLIQWINGDGEKWGLSVHPEGKTKDGASIVPSENIEGARKDSAVKTMYAIGIDIDSGTSLQHVLDKLVEEEIFATVYTTFSHRKTEFELKHDDVMRKMKLDESPNRTQIQEYLRLHHATRFDREFISQVEVVEARKQTKDGMRIVLKTPPIDKFRVVIPLAEPVELADLAPTLSGWKEIWADKVAGVCRNILDAHFDTASCDVNRLFYTPRHPKDGEWYSAIIMGNPLSFDDIEPYSKAKYVREREPDGDPFLAGSGGNEREMFLMPESGRSLNDWHRKAKGRFLLVDAIEAHAADKVRTAGGERDGTIHIECPFEHEHSSSGGTATMVMNPHANEQEVWTIFCHHDTCKGRHKLEFLQQMLADEWFPESVLEDEEFLLMDESEEAPEPTADADDPFSVVDEVAKFSDRTRAEDIKKFMKRQLRLNVDPAVKAAITKKLVEVTELGKAGVNGLWKEVAREREQKEREAAAEDIENFEGYPVTNMWDFKKMVEWAEKRIQAHNAAKPSLFHYMDGVARVRQNAQGKWHIHILTKDEFASELNQFTTWNHQTMMGDQVRTRGVSAPDDVVKTIFFDVDAVYPPLRGLITSPAFTRDGDLITEPGYHESGLFYAPDLTLDIPAINDKPTEQEVSQAIELIVSETLADFPFAGLTRDEIIEEVMNGDGVPAVTHILAMLLLFFCRELVEGPTPGHLLGKPAPGTGASLLTDVISIIATGGVTPASAMPSNSEEMGKTITALLASGTNMIFFDNINHGVDSGELASAITSPEYKARILGKSELVDTEVRCIWTLTGNNVQLSSEILRRCVLIDLDAQSSEPEKRSGWKHDDIRSWAKDNRGELVWACLTIIQNWIAEGKPLYKEEALNSFENWSGVVGGILKSAGIKGFLGNRQELKAMASDGRENDIVVLLEEWWNDPSLTPGAWIATRTVEKSDKGPEKMGLADFAFARDIQLSVKRTSNADGDMKYNAQQFEAFLTKYQNRVYPLGDGDEVRLEKSAEPTRNGYEWRLKKMNQVVGNV